MLAGITGVLIASFVWGACHRFGGAQSDAVNPGQIDSAGSLCIDAHCTPPASPGSCEVEAITEASAHASRSVRR